MKTLTVKELAEQLATMVELGHGDNPILYMDRKSAVYPFDTGVHDVWKPIIVRGVETEETVILG